MTNPKPSLAEAIWLAVKLADQKAFQKPINDDGSHKSMIAMSDESRRLGIEAASRILAAAARPNDMDDRPDDPGKGTS